MILECNYVIIMANELPWPGLLWADGGNILIGQTYYIQLLEAKAREGNSLQLLSHRRVQCSWQFLAPGGEKNENDVGWSFLERK